MWCSSHYTTAIAEGRALNPRAEYYIKQFNGVDNDLDLGGYQVRRMDYVRAEYHEYQFMADSPR
jgi:hypothetical protein